MDAESLARSPEVALDPAKSSLGKLAKVNLRQRLLGGPASGQAPRSPVALAAGRFTPVEKRTNVGYNN